MKDVKFIILENVQEQGQNLILLFFDCPECIDNSAFKQIEDSVKPFFYL